MTLPLIGAQVGQGIRQRAPRQWRQWIDLGPPSVANRDLTVSDHAVVGVAGVDWYDPSHGSPPVGHLHRLTVHHPANHAAGMLLEIADADPHVYMVAHAEGNRWTHRA